MALFQSYLCMTVMAAVFAATCGLSIRSPNSAIFGDPMKGQLFRHVRDADGGDEGNETETAQGDVGPCWEIMSCIRTNDNYDFVYTVMDFDLENAASNIARHCEGSPGFDCPNGGCGDMQGYLEFMQGVMNLFCANQERFIRGTESSCFNSEFHTAMQGCLGDHRTTSPIDPAMDELLACFALVPQNRPSCTEEDVSFVATLTNGIVNVARTAYARNDA